MTNIRTIQRRMGEFFAYADADTLTAEQKQKYREQGQKAFGSKKKTSDNPYRLSTDAGHSWLLGWQDGYKSRKADSDDPFSKGDRVKINAPGLPGHGKTGKILGKHSDHYQIESGPDDNKNWMHPASRLTRADATADSVKRGDTAWESGLEPNMPRIVEGRKGMKNATFKKRFSDAKSMERWMDSPDADYNEITRVYKA